MTRFSVRSRLLVGTLALSAVLHAALLGGLPGWPIAVEPVAEPLPLQARLLPPPREPASERVQRVEAKPAAPAGRPKRPVRPMAAPVEAPPVPAVTNASPADVAAAEIDPAPAASGEAEPAILAAPAADAPTPEALPADAPGPPAEYPLRRVRLVYDLLHSDSQTRIGLVTHTFETDGERYAAEAVAEAVGLVSLFYGGRFVQRSRGSIGPDGLVPEEYTLERGRGDPPERAVFDWPHGKVDLAWRDERRTVALPEGAQDPISALHQIYFMQPMDMSSRVSVATGRKLDEYTYELLGDADLLTPLGMMRTLHVGRVSTDGSVLEVWLDRDRELLPVRIYSRDRKGTILDQVVREVALLE
jgi:hypothetical protein